MDSSDSLKLDENLARFLAAYDQSIEGGNADEVTMFVTMPAEDDPQSPPQRHVTPMQNGQPNEGSLGEVLPDLSKQNLGRYRIEGYPQPRAVGGSPHVGRFELRRQLGKGGCGIVFLAFDPKLQREVALKLPRPEMLLNSDAKRRLIREALAAAEFDHPNLVPVFETGEIGPLCYIATAFCPGQTLAEWLEKQAFPVPVRQAARLLAIVAEAVQHAHDRGVLHRDLKPNNVILQEMKVEEIDEPPPGSVQLRGVYYVPRLVDFGLAKLDARGGPSETGTRQILGTPKYMAPEQAQARREDIGPPADVYALGVILYELIVGRAPFDGESDVEILRQAVEGHPVSPRDIRPDIPRDLEAICLRAMARDTTARYRTAIDFADDLRRFLDGLPTLARPLAWSGRVSRWLRRNDQFVAIAVLIMIIFLVIGVGSWNWQLSRQLRIDHDRVLGTQAARYLAEQELVYARRIRDAHQAWRGGHYQVAGEELVMAMFAASWFSENPEFAHEYLRRLVQSGQLNIVCPAGPVVALAISPDGSLLASGHPDGTLALWDRATGKQLAAVKAHHGEVKQLAFALSGTLILTAGKTQDSAMAVLGWHLPRAGTIPPATGDHRVLVKDITCFALAVDSHTIVAGGKNGLLLTRRLNQPAPVVIQEPKEGRPSITLVAISRNGSRFITADQHGTITQYNSECTPVLEFMATDVRYITSLAVTDAGQPLVGCDSGYFRIPTSWREPLHFVARESAVRWIALAENGSFAMNGRDGRVCLNAVEELFTSDVSMIQAGVFSPDGQMLFTGSEEGVIRCWPLGAEFRLRSTLHVGKINTLAASPDGSRVIAATDRSLISISNHSNSKVMSEAGESFRAVAFRENGTPFTVQFEDREVVLRNIQANAIEEVFRLTLPSKSFPSAVAITPDGAWLIVGDTAGRATVWSVANRAIINNLDTGVRAPIRHVAISADGGNCAASAAAEVLLWKIGTPEIVVKIAADEQAVFRFHPANNKVLTAGNDGVVRVWTLAGREELVFYGHTGRVTGLGISPNGRTLVSGCVTGDVRFWDLRTGQEFFGLRRHSTAVKQIEFAANGNLMITGGDGQFAVWDIRE